MADKSTETSRNYPATCDIYENDGKVILAMEMPGISKEMLDIKVEGDHLVIRGKRNSAKQSGNYLIREIKQGDYYNDFSLDETIDRNKIDASVKNGIVIISCGIKESERPKKITVSSK
jgi:HSP20 family protein